MTFSIFERSLNLIRSIKSFHKFFVIVQRRVDPINVESTLIAFWDEGVLRILFEIIDLKLAIKKIIDIQPVQAQSSFLFTCQYFIWWMHLVWYWILLFIFLLFIFWIITKQKRLSWIKAWVWLYNLLDVSWIILNFLFYLKFFDFCLFALWI